MEIKNITAEDIVKYFYPHAQIITKDRGNRGYFVRYYGEYFYYISKSDIINKLNNNYYYFTKGDISTI